MEQKIKLKPCPFCGAEAVMDTIKPHYYEGETFIECTGCTCAIAEKTEHEAIEAWNRRVDNA